MIMGVCWKNLPKTKISEYNHHGPHESQYLFGVFGIVDVFVSTCENPEPNMADNQELRIIRIGTLNIGAAAKERAKRILREWIMPLNLDVYVLTETSEGAGSQFLFAEFTAAGWSVRKRPLREGDRGVFIASRIMTSEFSQYPNSEYSNGRAVVVELETTPSVQLVGMYVPNRGNDFTKTQRKKDFMDTWMQFFQDRQVSHHHRIVLGDLNIVPKSQSPKFLPQDSFEYLWYDRLCGQVGLYDAALANRRSQHESTWVAHTGEGYTYDHILPSNNLKNRVIDFVYDHSTRAMGSITDHSALILTVQLDAVTRLKTHPLGVPSQGTLF